MNATVKSSKENVRRIQEEKRTRNRIVRRSLRASITTWLRTGKYQAILIHIHYSPMLTGPFRRELRAPRPLRLTLTRIV